MDGYDTAIVCRSGHVINCFATSNRDDNARFCPTCGAPGVGACEKCSESIRGVGSVLYVPPYEPPSYCRGCGAPYPWTETRIQALALLIAESGAAAEEKQKLTESIRALGAEGPGTPVAILRFKRFFAGTGKDLLSIARQLVVDVAGEAVKRQLFG